MWLRARSSRLAERIDLGDREVIPVEHYRGDRMRSGRALAAGMICLVSCSGGGARVPAPDPIPSTPPPAWLAGDGVDGDQVCAVGIAGRTHEMAREKAKEFSRERAVRNLAGVFETIVEDSEIDEATVNRTDIEFARAVTVDEELVARVDEAAEVEFWIDGGGLGPFEERGFTYARACVPASFLPGESPKKVAEAARAASLTAESPPPWLEWVGSQKGARLCAVGFSLPALHPEATFENVVEEIRAQLTGRSKSLVMSLSEEFSVCKNDSEECEQVLKIVTAATNEAVSKGVLVNHFWYDRRGVGPNKRQRSTYGWGCTHPVGALAAAVAKVKEELPEIELPKREQVEKRAAELFDELEQEEAKHE
jgi:hypothetical protein